MQHPQSCRRQLPRRERLSIVPTMRIISWRRAGVGHGCAFTPAAVDLLNVRRFLWAEVAFFALIPTFAAAMARGYGSFAH